MINSDVLDIFNQKSILFFKKRLQSYGFWCYVGQEMWKFWSEIKINFRCVKMTFKIEFYTKVLGVKETLQFFF